MNIGLVCPYDLSRPGGVQIHVLELARQLKRKKHSVLVIAPGKPDSGWEDIEVFNTGFMRPISIFGTRFELSWMDKPTRTRLAEKLTSLSIDLIHFHTFWAPLMPVQVRLLSSSQHIITFHDTPAIGPLHGILRFFMQTLSRSLSLFFHRFISVSASQSTYVKSGRLKKIHIIPNGINAAHFAPNSDFDKSLVEPFILFLGRFEPRKGARFALNVFENLRSSFPNLKLIMAGDGEDRVLLEKRVSENQISNVVFAGRVDETEKKRLLQQARVVLAPALYGESFGIILLEAMAALTPVAGFGNSGYINLAKDYAPELFPEPGDTNALSDAVKKILIDQDFSNELVLKGQKMAKEHDWDAVSDTIIRQYETVLRWQTARVGLRK